MTNALTRVRTINADTYHYRTSIIFGVTGCSATIPAGTYEVSAYIDDVLYRKGTATSVGGRGVSAENQFILHEQ